MTSHEHHSVSNHQELHCSDNRSFRRISKDTSKLRLIGLLSCRMFESSCQSQFDRRLCFSVVELPVVVKRSHKLNANIGASRLCETPRNGLISYLFIEVIKDTYPWASCQIRKIAGAHAPGMPGTFSPSPQVSDPDMHHGTCVTHVPWCMPGSLTSGFIWNRRRGETFPAFPAHAQPAILRIW